MRFIAVLLGIMLVLVLSGVASAHQPFPEIGDFGAESPFSVRDASVSTAIYATLDSKTDVDYYIFDATAGQSVLLALTIPQIEGQELFAPEMAVIGPGFSRGEELDHIFVDADQGFYWIPSIQGRTRTFFEPFSRTAYWERQEEWVEMPETGTYTVAVWHDNGEVGRYVFVIGHREVPGGDPRFWRSRADYWTPVEIDETGAAAPVRQEIPVRRSFWTKLWERMAER